MSSLSRALRAFFFPPAGSPRWARALPYAVLGILTLLVLTASAYVWDYTNSPPFCGTTCHTMPPEYTAYLTSPHARIDCVDCHIGKGFIATRISRKAGDLKHVFATVFHAYEYPIRAGELRPARETCEKCHSPAKFSDDSLRTIVHYASDKDNTATTTYLVLKTGGGSKRLGLGKGIHWHIENPVYYLATDVDEQTIPFVRVVNGDGSVTDYQEIGSTIDPATVQAGQLKQMDCITCHNRITHLIYQPEDSLDLLMKQGVISAKIPEIHSKAVEAMRAPYATVDEAMAGIAALADYYQDTYPDFVAQNGDLISNAIRVVQETYRNSVFIDQKATWDSHPNNVGHQESPGCFRCHDGKHLTQDSQAIRLECNLCHSIPVVAGPDKFISDIEISRGPEPQSHLSTSWIQLHRDAFDASCSNCHSTANAGGTDNSSFCSNSACHGSAWKYAGFDAPGLRELLLAQLPTPTPTQAPTATPVAPVETETPGTPAAPAGPTYAASIAPLFQARCVMCHGESGQKGLNLTTYASAMKGGTDGPVIIAGDPASSLLIQKQSGAQPHFGQLTPDELALVTAWIQAGAPEK
jgi:nitrate/TMAO reductase-like tetraheme cytochrome c subunit/mono/diheme cytochrome c family protein